MEDRKRNIEIPKVIAELTGAEFLSFLYSERDREESLNSYQGWNVWAVVGALITVMCTAYGVLEAHTGEIDRVRTIYLLSYSLSCIFGFWNAFLTVLSFTERKRAVDYKRMKRLKEVAPIPYLIVTTACSLEMAMGFIVINIVNSLDWNIVAISWIVLGVLLLLICISVYVNRNAIVWAVKEDVWFVRTWIMVVVGLTVFAFFWLIWKWSYHHITGPYIGKPEFELAACLTAIVMLTYLLLKIKLANRKSSELDVLIDEYVFKGKTKEDVYRQLRAKVKESFINGTVDIDNLDEKFSELKKSLDHNDEWAARVDALHDKVDEIDRNVPQLKNEEEFGNMLKIVGYMMGKGREMNVKIKSVIEEMQRYMDEQRSEVK